MSNQIDETTRKHLDTIMWRIKCTKQTIENETKHLQKLEEAYDAILNGSEAKKHLFVMRMEVVQ